MSSDAVIYAMIGVCLCVIMLFIFSKPLKLLFKLLINSGLGVLALIGVNFMLSPFSISVGINALSIMIVGVLGIPGFLCLYLTQLIL